MAKTQKPAAAGATRAMNPPVVEVPGPTTCPTCGSARRSKYYAAHVQEHAGVTAAGRPYTRILRRRCRCEDCGQVRIDRQYA